MRNIQPIDDRILVRRVIEAEQKVGSIIVPDSAREKPQLGTVLAVGTDEELRSLFALDDQVLFARYSGAEIELDGEELIILQRGDVLAKVS